jgi:hypothetical protein
VQRCAVSPVAASCLLSGHLRLLLVNVLGAAG